MMELDVFPDALREQAVAIGSVLKMEMSEDDKVHPRPGHSTKFKRFVIIGKSQDRLVASLLINSKINQNLYERIGPYQHQIYCEEYEFLDHDSFIDGFLIREFSVSRVLESATYLGAIKKEDLTECIKHACESPVAKKYLLKKYGLID